MSFSNFSSTPHFINNNYSSYSQTTFPETQSNNLGMNNNMNSNMFSLSPLENLSYGMITPQYSPETTVAITLRHFEKESKSQAENEYDDENGALPPPPPEDDPTVHPDDRKAHKKKRKVRSAIVSRRKTAIYLEKLEGELDTREGMNAQLNKNLSLYREVITDIRAKIEAMERSLAKRNDSTPTKRVRSSNPWQTSPSSKIKKVKRSRNHHYNPIQQLSQHSYQQINSQSLYNGYQQQQQQIPQQEYSSRSIDSSATFLPNDPTTPPSEVVTPPPSSSHTYHQVSSQSHQNNSNQEFFLNNNQGNVNEIFSSISSEEIDDAAVPQNQPSQQVHQLLHQYQVNQQKKQIEGDFSECSDRNMSPVMRPGNYSNSLQEESNMQNFPVQVSSQQQFSWKQSFQPGYPQNNPLLI